MSLLRSAESGLEKKGRIADKVFGSTEYIFWFGVNSVYGDLGISQVLGSAPWISGYLLGSAGRPRRPLIRLVLHTELCFFFFFPPL